MSVYQRLSAYITTISKNSRLHYYGKIKLINIFDAIASYHMPIDVKYTNFNKSLLEIEKLRKKKYPLKYFFLSWLPELILVDLKYSIKNFIDFFKYRFIKKHQHHIIRTKLKPGYYDCAEKAGEALETIFLEHMNVYASDFDTRSISEKEFKIYHYLKVERPILYKKIDYIYNHTDKKYCAAMSAIDSYIEYKNHEIYVEIAKLIPSMYY